MNKKFSFRFVTRNIMLHQVSTFKYSRFIFSKIGESKMGQNKSVTKDQHEENKTNIFCKLASIVNAIHESDNIDYEMLSNKTSM